MADLSTLTSRRRLPRDGTKRWTRLANGRGLGYRRSRAAAGTWYVRLHVGRLGLPHDLARHRRRRGALPTAATC